MTEESLYHPNISAVNDSSSEQENGSTISSQENPRNTTQEMASSEVLSKTAPSMSRRTRLFIGLGAGIGALAGIAGAAVGLSSAGSESNQSDVAIHSSETGVFPVRESFVELGLASGTLNQESTKGLNIDEIIKYNPTLSSPDSGKIFLPAPFDPKGQEIQFQHTESKLSDGTKLGRLSFQNITEDTRIKSPFDGKVYSLDINNEATGDYKEFVFQVTNGSGREMDLLMIVPKNVTLNADIPTLSDGKAGDGIGVSAGESLFTIGKDSLLANGHNMEINAVVGQSGDESSLKQGEVNLMQDPSTGKIPFIN